MLTVLQVAYPFAPVSLDAAGGAEQVVAMLDRGVEARGHHSLVLACEGSRTAGTLVPFRISPPFDEDRRRAVRQQVYQMMIRAIDTAPVDLIHMHGLDFHEYLPPEGVPVLATLHMPAGYYPESAFQVRRPRTYWNCVSIPQCRSFAESPELVGSIENGIPLELFPPRSTRREGYALAMGRVCPEKGFHLALEAAEQAGVPLWLAGKVYPYEEHERYCREMLLPRFSPPHRFLGPVNFAEKIRLLSRARCVLLSSTVPESASLVGMEAMACGTPIISFALGAPAGYIEEGRTGFLVRDVGEMARAIPRCGEIRAADCRALARQLFSADRMVDRYIELYKRLSRAANSRSFAAI